MLLVSTAADLYWLGRYFSRSQALVELLLASLNKPTVENLGVPLSITGTWQHYYQQYTALSPEGLAEFFVVAHHPSSLSACLEATRVDAQATRGRMTDTLWISINRVWLEWQERTQRIGVYSDHVALYQWLHQALAEIRQLIDSTSDVAVYNLLQIGMLIETLDDALRKLMTPDVSAPACADIVQTAQALAHELQRLDSPLWHNSRQAGQHVLALCQAVPEHTALSSAREIQHGLQTLTQCLTEAFAT